MRGCSPYWHLRGSCPLVVTALGVAAQLTDATGGAIFDGVPRGFDGYFKVTRADIRPILSFPGRLVRDVETLTPAAETARIKAGAITVAVMGPTP